jgi:hypothetical protein
MLYALLRRDWWPSCPDMRVAYAGRVLSTAGQSCSNGIRLMQWPPLPAFLSPYTKAYVDLLGLSVALLLLGCPLSYPSVSPGRRQGAQGAV